MVWGVDFKVIACCVHRVFVLRIPFDSGCFTKQSSGPGVLVICE